MKRILAMLLVLVLCLSMCACGAQNKPKGSYTATIAGRTFGTMTFSGNKVTFETRSGASNGTFVMDGNTVVITFENGNSDKLIYDAESDTLNLGGLVFEKN